MRVHKNQFKVNMNRDTIKTKVFEIVSSELKADINSIKEESSFTDDLKADSLDVVEVIMKLEDDFGIEIPDEVAQGMQTMKDTIDYVEDQVKKNNAPS